MEATVLHCHGHDETTDKHHVGGIEVVDGHLLGGDDPEQRKENLENRQLTIDNR